MQPGRDYHATSLVAIFNAEYGINLLKAVPREYVFYLRGTLACLRSIPDYLLQEFNEELNLGIPLDEHLDAKSFMKRAQKTKNKQALRFIRLYNRKWKAMMKDRTAESVLGPSGERNLVIHRRPSIMSVQTINLAPDQRYENVGEPTLHFIRKKDGAPSVQDIPNTLDYCLTKLKNFRGALIFGSEAREAVRSELA